ncbi:MAG: carbohydrate kinase family protein [Eubacteriaceae bacterium]|nr:carbohydrate kinase family protein [Eubacteriaceae bacterium]
MNKISVIGGINVNVKSKPYVQVKPGGSNPGTLSLKLGGSGRNIAANLAKLGLDVSFITKAGKDFSAAAARDELAGMGVDVSNIVMDENGNTPATMEVLNVVDDVEMAFGNSDILETADIKMFESAMDTLKSSSAVCMDANLSAETLEYLTKELEGVTLFMDPAAVEKADRVSEIIGRFHTVLPNRAEAERMTGKTILSEDQLMEAGQWFLDRGVERVFIKIGAGGVYYNDKGRSGIAKPEKGITVIDNYGAGDAFSAAALYGHINGMDIEETVKFAMAAAAMNLETDETVNEKMSVEELKRRM